MVIRFRNESVKDETTEQEEWINDLDVKKYAVEIHSDFKEFLGPDFKIAHFGEEEKQLIARTIPAIMSIHNLCPDKDIAKKIQVMDMHFINTLAILNFNQKKNHLLNKIFNKDDEKDDEGNLDEFANKLRDKIRKED